MTLYQMLYLFVAFMWKVLSNAVLYAGVVFTIAVMVSLVMTNVFHIKPATLVRRFIGGGSR